MLEGELYERDGETYLRYTSITLKVRVGDGRVKLGNLFGGDKVLSKYR